MKKLCSFSIPLFFLLSIQSFPQYQIVKGKLVDENDFGLAGIDLQLYISPNVYNTTSLSDGSFYFNLITNIEEDGQLPSGYSITNNFPNPFNPSTRIGITLPRDGNVKVGVYNILGQKVTDEINRYFSAGAHFLDIDLEGLPSGFYIARISIDEKFMVVKKMMLVYGSQHLSATGSAFNNQFYKSNNNSSALSTNIDSLVATSTIIGRKTFTNLPSIEGDTLDLGDLTIERYCPGLPTVTDARDGKVYNTVLIGEQCWLKENMNIGTRIDGILNQTNNATIEKYCYNNLETNCDTYGGLYQWNEAMQYVTTEGSQGICPEGWHIPKLAEFETLRAAVNNDGNSLKAVGQGTDAGAGTNTSGFSALLAGFRYHDGGFYYLGYFAGFWSSSEYDIGYASYLDLGDYGSRIYLGHYYGYKDFGFSVRCLKD